MPRPSKIDPPSYPSIPAFVNKYLKLLGELTWITNVRADVVYAVNVLAQYAKKPREKHWKGLLRILWYLLSTSNYGLFLGNFSSNVMEGYTDASYATERERRSRSGGLLFYHGSLISFICKAQKTTAQSTTEAEYYAMAEIAKLMIFFQNFLNKF